MKEHDKRTLVVQSHKCLARPINAKLHHEFEGKGTTIKRTTLDPQGNVLNSDSEIVQNIDNDPKLDAWPSQQTLKIGEPVMIRSNVDFSLKLVNGMIGHLEWIAESGQWAKVRMPKSVFNVIIYLPK